MGLVVEINDDAEPRGRFDAADEDVSFATVTGGSTGRDPPP